MAISLTRRAVILADVETSEGTDVFAGTGVGAKALLISNLNVQNKGEAIDREIVKQHLSRLGSVIGIYWGEVSFSTELRGPGQAVSAAQELRENPLFYACGMSPDYTVSASPTYKPKTDWGAVISSTTIYAYVDGLLHVIVGCHGNMSGEAAAGKFGKFNWTLQGTCAVLTDKTGNAVQTGEAIRDTLLSSITPSFQNSGTVPPAILGASLSVHGNAALTVQQVAWDLQNQVSRREDISKANGIASYIIGDRNPRVTVNPELVTRQTLDFFGKWKTAAEGSIQFTAGTGAYNRVVSKYPACQFIELNYGDRNGVRVLEATAQANALNKDVGDDEAQFIYCNAAN